MAPFEAAMVVSYIHCDRCTICTIRTQFAMECLRRSNQQGWVTLGENFGVFPLE